MKKIYYSVIALVLLSLVIFSGCKKINEGPFPAKPNAGGTSNDLSYITPYFPTAVGNNTGGILIAAQVHDQKTVIISLFENIYEYGMAKFTNTPGNFSSLASAGSVTLDGTSLTAASNNSYLSPTSNFTIGLGGSTAWQIGTPSFNYTLNGVYPLFTDSFQNWADNWLPIYPRPLNIVPTRPTYTQLWPNKDSMNPSFTADTTFYHGNISLINTYLTDSTQYSTTVSYNNRAQWSVPIKGYVFNADSVCIVLSDATGFFYKTTVSANDTVVNFAPNTFAGLSGYDVTSLTMQVNAIKYRDTTVSGKNYYFLKMGSYIKYYGATK